MCYENIDGKIKCQYEEYYKKRDSYKLFDYDDKKWCKFHNPDQNVWENTSSIVHFNKTIELILKSAIEKKEDIVDFSYTKFPKGFEIPQALYTACRSDIRISFKNCEFFGKIIFKSDTINIDFTNAILYESVIFIDCTLKDSSFNNTNFHSKTIFTNCTMDSTVFYKTQFREAVLFYWTTFCSLIDTNKKTVFESTTFCNDATFTNTVFPPDGIFKDVIFKKEVDFSYQGSPYPARVFAFLTNLQNTTETYFSNHSEEKPIKEIWGISFVNCKFNSSTFENRIFTAKTDFSSSVFYKAPLFHGCKFHQHTIFPEQKNFKETSSMEAAHAYRTIYLEMINLKSRDYVNMFYALMQKSERNSGTQPRSIRVASWLYEKTTTYGQSILKPIVLLIILTFFFGVVYALLTSPYYDLSSSINWNIVGNSMDTSIQQIVKPFSYYTESLAEKNTIQHPIIFKIATLIQSISSLSLIALLLLSLRWKFKKD